MSLPRFGRGRHDDAPPPEHEEPAVVQLDEEQLSALSAVFAAPRWLRDLGVLSWLLVGAGFLLFGLVWILGATAEITVPVTAAFVIAAVASPVVSWLQGHKIPRAAGAALVLLGLAALGVVIAILVIGGITSQKGTIKDAASQAQAKVAGWLDDAGVSTSGSSNATTSASKNTSETIKTLVHGVKNGISSLTSLAFGLSFFLLSFFFLLKDGPMMRGWVNRHLGVPENVADTITRGVVTSLRRYFAGVTIVGVFNAVVVGIGAWALDVPLAGTIAVVTFVTAYIPYIGAFVSGAFAVVMALSTGDSTTAAIMLVIVILANGGLQQIVQPIAFGATLSLNPLVVLIVTIGAGCLFGMIGLVLGAPLTSAAVHIQADLARAKAEAAAVAELPLEPEPEPA
jgi:predicted PurR-regulated permease PerM